MKKKKGFTLVELLVVIAIIALLMGILMPALARVRRMAQRMVCGTNLSGIGKAMLVYSNENNDRFPVAGLHNSAWTDDGEIEDWDGETRDDAYGERGGDVTITSCFYLLIKYADATPELFVCGGDTGTTEFDLAEADPQPDNFSIVDAWDFGDASGQTQPGDHCSYAYHLPVEGDAGRTFPMSTTSNSSSPLAADRNVFLDSDATYVNDSGGATNTDEDDDPEWDSDNREVVDEDGIWNTSNHQREGQNVLYVDSHVSFENDVTVGIQEDNIWGYWSNDPSGGSFPDDQQRQMGDQFPKDVGEGGPKHYEDAYLVNEVESDF